MTRDTLEAATSGPDVGLASASAPSVDTPRRSLKSLALKGTLWTVVGHGSGQLIRLVSNLVLTRVLFPEAFGVMALVTLVLQGLSMFSDIGVAPSVIRSKRGAEPVFLNTAWTLQLVRGTLLALVACVLAWPMSLVYGEASLLTLIPVASISSVLTSLGSMSMITLRRDVNIRPLVLRDIAASVVGLLATVGLALVWRSVWALVIGSVIRAAVGSALTYVLLPGPRPWLCWDRDAVREIYSFGRWIFLSTALAFLLSSGDRAVVGLFVAPETLGVFSIAVFLSRAVFEVLTQINGSVLFPVFSELARSRPEALRVKLRHVRLVVLALCLPPLWALALWGREVVELMYDDRYLEAGWMLQVLAVGAIPTIVTVTGLGTLLSVGDSFGHMVVQATRVLALLAAMLVGGWGWGMVGLVFGVAVGRVLEYPAMVWAARRHRVWMPDVDLLAFAASGAVLSIAFILHRLFWSAAS